VTRSFRRSCRTSGSRHSSQGALLGHAGRQRRRDRVRELPFRQGATSRIRGQLLPDGSIKGQVHPGRTASTSSAGQTPSCRGGLSFLKLADPERPAGTGDGPRGCQRGDWLHGRHPLRFVGVRSRRFRSWMSGADAPTRFFNVGVSPRRMTGRNSPSVINAASSTSIISGTAGPATCSTASIHSAPQTERADPGQHRRALSRRPSCCSSSRAWLPRPWAADQRRGDVVRRKDVGRHRKEECSPCARWRGSWSTLRTACSAR